MIRFLIAQNRQGKPRIQKWFVGYSEKEKQKIILEIHQKIISRDSRFTNFIEFRNFKVVYSRFAGLYFTLCIDYTDNELANLELIQLFVEILDQYFGNVCELDLIFNFHKVDAIVGEMIVGGEIVETSKKKILDQLRKFDTLK